MRVAALVVLLAGCDDDYILGGGGGGAGSDRVDAVLALTGDADAGEGVFDDNCAACHDKTGQEKVVGPALGPYVPTADETEMINVILGGQGTMPAQDLTDQETADVIAWMEREFGGSAAPDGASLFDDQCKVCHNADGTAKVGPGLANIVPNRTSQQLYDTINNGVPPAMPAFSSRMTVEEVDTLVTWMMERWPAGG